jgi:hypothetical protein
VRIYLISQLLDQLDFTQFDWRDPPLSKGGKADSGSVMENVWAIPTGIFSRILDNNINRRKNIRSIARSTGVLKEIIDSTTVTL